MYMSLENQPPARGRRESQVVQKACSCQGKKAEVKVEGKSSWFCKGPSSCVFFFFSSIFFVAAQTAVWFSQPGRKTTARSRAGLCCSLPDRQVRTQCGAKTAPGPRSVCPLRGSLAQRLCCWILDYFFFLFLSPGCGNVCGKSEVWDRKPAKFW